MSILSFLKTTLAYVLNKKGMLKTNTLIFVIQNAYVFVFSYFLYLHHCYLNRKLLIQTERVQSLDQSAIYKIYVPLPPSLGKTHRFLTVAIVV